MKAIIFICLFFLGASSQAKSLQGIQFQDQILMNGKRLTLNGLGLREATFFMVDVYVAALYLEKISQNPHDIINSQQDILVQMHFVRAIAKKRMAKAFQRAIELNNSENYPALRERVEQLGQNMIDTQVGTQITFRIQNEKTSIEVDGIKKGHFIGRDFAKAILKCWIGQHPPNQGLKDGMLGLPQVLD